MSIPSITIRLLARFSIVALIRPVAFDSDKNFWSTEGNLTTPVKCNSPKRFVIISKKLSVPAKFRHWKRASNSSLLTLRLKLEPNSSLNDSPAINLASSSIELSKTSPSSKRIIAFLKLSSPAKFIENSLGVLLRIHSSASSLLISLSYEKERSE